MSDTPATVRGIYYRRHYFMIPERIVLLVFAIVLLWPGQGKAVSKSKRFAGMMDDAHAVHSRSGSQESESKSKKPGNSDQASQSAASGLPVDLVADNLSYDQKAQNITASGNVELVRGERILRAENVTYNLKDDIVRARGDVVLVEPGGEVIFAETVRLKQGLKRGFVKKIHALLTDGSRLRAARGEHIADEKTVMHDASYTPCKPCKKNPEAAPIWRISADKVTHDKQDRTIAYDNATLDIYGLPVLYTPYFQHPDGTIDRESGFLLPGFGLDSELGASVLNKYYWNIAPSLDATIGAEIYANEKPRGTLELRKRFENARLEARGSVTESARAGVANAQEETRGHIFADGRWHINKNWRTGFDIATASDDQYLRQYNITGRDVLENELYAERFGHRNYFGARLLNFQDVRVRERQTEQPDVLPAIETQLLSPHDRLLGGRLGLEASFLGLRRDEERRELNRISVGPSWRKRLVSGYGLVSRLEFAARGDLYNVRDDASLAGDGDTTEGRLYPYAHYEGRYPLINQLSNGRLVVTPRASITLAPDIEKDDDIPNEDSRDVQLDASNLFEPNRFPGLDRVEDGAHAAYGLQAGIYHRNGSRIEALFGQSRRLDGLTDADNPFPEGSGLASDVSDFVGEIEGQYKSIASLQYRFQYDGQDFAAKRHEFDAGARIGDWDLSTRYLFASSLAGTDITSNREQLRSAIGYRISEDWRVNTASVYDFGENSGLRRGELGVEYTGQCFTISGKFQRNLVNDVTGQSETEFVLRLGLRNLGSVETSGIGVSRTGE